MILTDIYSKIPPGSHKVVVKLRLASATILEEFKIVSVANNYTELSVGAFKYIESLLGCDQTGVMYVNVVGGKKPFKITVDTYTGTGLTNPTGKEYDSVGTGQYASRHYFRDLPSGAYRFKIEDDCGSIEYASASLGTIDLTNLDRWVWWSSNARELNTYNWINSCDFYVNPGLNSYYSSGGVVTSEIQNYYNNYGLSFEIDNMGRHPIGTKKELQVLNSNFSKEIKIYGPCGLIASKVLNTKYEFLQTYADLGLYHKNINACDSLSVIFNNYTRGDLFRVKVNGIESDWAAADTVPPYPGSHYPPGIGTSGKWLGGFASGYSSHGVLLTSGAIIEVQIKNRCGGLTEYMRLKPQIYSASLLNETIRKPCSVNSTDITFKMYNYNLFCPPVKAIITNVQTGQIYEKILPLDKIDTLYNLPDGEYRQKYIGSDGYEATYQYTFKLERRKAGYLNLHELACEEKKGYFQLVGIPHVGARVQLLESPPGTSYYYDRPTTSSSWEYIYPDNGKAGLYGNYKFRVTDSCGISDTFVVPLNKGFIVEEFTIDTVSIDCSGLTIKPTVRVRNYPTASPTNSYYGITGPVGFQNKNNVSSGTPILLNMAGRYIIGARNCLRYDTIYYDGGGLGFDLNKSVAFVCPESQINEGRIHVVGIGGDGTYTYYLSNNGDGGGQVITDPSKYIATNNTGQFYNYNLSKGTTYDVTLVDGCGSVRVQKFTIGDLKEVRIAFVDKNPVCIGEPIQFKSMALPNPTFEWFKPGALTSFSNLSDPVINPASLSDAGIYKVSITTSLCINKIEDIEVPVDVQPAPTLIKQTGSDDQEICRGNTIQEIVYKWGGSVTDVTITGLTSGLTSTKDIGDKTITISGIANSNSTYTVKTVGGCSDLQISGTITVSNPPTLYLSSGNINQVVCLNDNNNSVNNVYRWTNVTTDVDFAGTLPTGLTHTINTVTNELRITGVPTQKGTFSYTITAKTTDPSNVCPNTELTGTITVLENITTPDVETTVPGLTVLIDVLANDDNVSVGALHVASAKMEIPADSDKGTVSIVSDKIRFIPKNTYTFNNGEQVHLLYTVKDANNAIICGEEKAIVVVYVVDFVLVDECSFEPKLQANLLDDSFELQWQKSTNNTSWTNISAADKYILPSKEIDSLYYRLVVKKGAYTSNSKSIKLKSETKTINNRIWYNVSIE